jgi:hypothetical protein
LNRPPLTPPAFPSTFQNSSALEIHDGPLPDFLVNASLQAGVNHRICLGGAPSADFDRDDTLLSSADAALTFHDVCIDAG